MGKYYSTTTIYNAIMHGDLNLLRSVSKQQWEQMASGIDSHKKRGKMLNYAVLYGGIDILEYIHEIPFMKGVCCSEANLNEVLFSLHPEHPVYRHVIKCYPISTISLSDFLFENKSSNLSIKLLQQLFRLGVQFRFDDEIPWYHLTHRYIGYHKNYKTISQWKKMLRAYRYLLIHIGISKETAMDLLKKSYIERVHDLVNVLIDYVDNDQVDKLATKYKTYAKLANHPNLPRSKAKARISLFINKEMQKGGKLDNLLYQPPDGLMIKRSLRILQISD